MPKFRKFSTADGTVVLVPDSYYNRLLDSIRCSSYGLTSTKMYVYWLDADGVMWRRSTGSSISPERVISQWSFNPEVYFV